MVVAVWSVKGGVGVSSVAALLAIGQAERAEDTVLIDLCGDVPLLLGCEDVPAEPGIAEWSAMAPPTADALARIEVQARPSLTFVPRGRGPVGDLTALLSVLETSRRQIIVDCGTVADDATPRGRVVGQSDVSLLVVRECFLTLRALQTCTLRATGVVVIKEKNRDLGRADVERAAQAPVVAELAADPRITSALDAGLVNARLPRTLLRSMGRVLERVA